MKIRKELIRREIAGDVILVPVDEAEQGFGHGEMMNAICILSHYFYLRMKKNLGNMDKKSKC